MSLAKAQLRFSLLDGYGLKALFLGGEGLLSRSVRAMLTHNDLCVHMRADPEAFLAECRRGGCRYDFILVDADRFGGPAALYDRLRRMRALAPGAALVLLSAEFERDEYGTHRLYLADVSLTVPVMLHALELGLLQASVNNTKWRRRADEARALEIAS